MRKITDTSTVSERVSHGVVDRLCWAICPYDFPWNFELQRTHIFVSLESLPYDNPGSKHKYFMLNVTKPHGRAKSVLDVVSTLQCSLSRRTFCGGIGGTKQLPFTQRNFKVSVLSTASIKHHILRLMTLPKTPLPIVSAI